MARTIMDHNLLRWEAYVSGGQPDSAEAARIYFVCLDLPMDRARYVEHLSRDVAEAERELLEMGEDDLRKLLDESVPND